MLTVKLVRGEAVKIVEGSTVDVATIPGGGRSVTVSGPDAGATLYTVGRGEDAYDIAYVENARGQTTQIVRP